jgi:hypothetical protein
MPSLAAWRVVAALAVRAARVRVCFVMVAVKVVTTKFFDVVA